MKTAFLSALVIFAFASHASAVCDKTTTKDNVTAADAECDKAKKGEVCILAHKPEPACGMPGPKDADCKRDKVCKSGKCNQATGKCM